MNIIGCTERYHCAKQLGFMNFVAKLLYMILQVFAHMTIADLQQKFNEYFPYLSLSFFSKPHDIYQASPVKYLITERETCLERLEDRPHNAALNIISDMTAGQLEQLFEQELGLHVQVLRKDGDSWTETTLTDSLSLREQNAQAIKTKNMFCAAQPANYHDARTEWYLG